MAGPVGLHAGEVGGLLLGCTHPVLHGRVQTVTTVC